MTKDLATVKQAYLITLSNWDKETVLLESAPNRTDIIDSKKVVSLDWITINASFIVSVKQVDLNDTGVDSAIAYAKSLKWAMRLVACERVRSYEAKNGAMPLQKLKDWLQSFIEEGKSKDREKRYKIYISAGGNPDEIL